MKYFALALLLTAQPALAGGAHEADMCKVLRSFVESVKPRETREFTFRTCWCAFKDMSEEAVSSKRCDHGNYEPAQKVCTYLMKHGLVEFADNNVKEAVTCLSKKTHFAPLFELSSAAFRFDYGSDKRGAFIEITYQPDEQIGGMLFRLKAIGY